MIPIGNKYTNTKVYKYMYMDRQPSTVSYYHDSCPWIAGIELKICLVLEVAKRTMAMLHIWKIPHGSLRNSQEKRLMKTTWDVASIHLNFFSGRDLYDMFTNIRQAHPYGRDHDYISKRERVECVKVDHHVYPVGHGSVEWQWWWWWWWRWRWWWWWLSCAMSISALCPWPYQSQLSISKCVDNVLSSKFKPERKKVDFVSREWVDLVVDQGRHVLKTENCHKKKNSQNWPQKVSLV